MVTVMFSERDHSGRKRDGMGFCGHRLALLKSNKPVSSFQGYWSGCDFSKASWLHDITTFDATVAHDSFEYCHHLSLEPPILKLQVAVFSFFLLYDLLMSLYGISTFSISGIWLSVVSVQGACRMCFWVGRDRRGGTFVPHKRLCQHEEEGVCGFHVGRFDSWGPGWKLERQHFWSSVIRNLSQSFSKLNLTTLPPR